jgi:hypothetical protein
MSRVVLLRASLDLSQSRELRSYASRNCGSVQATKAYVILSIPVFGEYSSGMESIRFMCKIMQTMCLSIFSAF